MLISTWRQARQCGMLWAMFMVPAEVAEAIRRTYEESGEFAAAIELRRHFPGITDNENARRCARVIAGWTPLPPQPVKKPRCKRDLT
jgi:hypothetical protein